MKKKKKKKIIHNEIIEKVDHMFLNEVDIFKEVVPTTERMAIVFWNILADKVKSDNAELHSVKLFETDKNFVEYRG